MGYKTNKKETILANSMLTKRREGLNVRNFLIIRSF